MNVIDVFCKSSVIIFDINVVVHFHERIGNIFVTPVIMRIALFTMEW